ncbi:MAG: FhaA domain-containing protein [Acidimicrobiales bacterium]
MLPLLALPLGALIGFVASRSLRRPQRAAQAASVARSVGGSMGRRRGLAAPELQRACFSEMVRHVRVDDQGRSVAPARYLIQLHPEDLATVDDARGWFTDGLAGALADAADANGWVLEGTVDIRYEAAEDRRPGVPRALAVEPGASTKAVPQEAPPAPTPRASKGQLVLERTDTGERWPLGTDEVVVGRSSDATVTIDDSRVSRSHAVLAPGRSGWTVTDAGSSNGTSVNGRLLTPNVARPVREGDRINVGPVELELRSIDEGPPEPGTRALDDRDATRISGQVLSPRRPRP